MKMPITMILSLTMILTGCASSSKEVAANYVSPTQYKAYDCEQLTSEAHRVQVKANNLAGQLDEAASNDKMIATGGTLLFWPALFALGGNDAQESEFANLKGEHDAIEEVVISKKCEAQFASNN